MRTRRHARSGGHVAVGLAAGVLLLGGGTAFAGHRYDAATSGRILPGVSIAGVDVGGMSRDEAILAVDAAAQRRLDREIEVTAAEKTWHVAPAEVGTTADVDAKVDRALALGREFAWPERALRRLFDRPVDRSLELEYSVDPAQISRFVQIVGRTVNVSAVNAAFELRGDRLLVTKPKIGRTLREKAAGRALAEAMASAYERAELPVKTTTPRVTADELGQTIVVRLSENKLHLYEGLKKRKTYPVATGSPGFPTPQGEWTVVDKVANPSWTNPAPDGWGASLPRYIAPGPGNPLGTRALYLDAPGIRIHGTYSSGSIGTYASHGCIRMHISDVEELFEIVEVDTPVLVFW